MSQLNEKRRLLYWKFCRTVRAWPALERLVTTLYRA
nr:MAG TPA: Translocator protein bipD, translocation, TRANSPORT PROTEIN.51A [Caudoviricetes sp.]